MSTVVKDLGAVSAYAYAVEKGYTGTEEEFAELMASYATVGQTAVNAAQTATTKASEAATSATTATNKASEATTAATTATTKAGEASTSANTATSAKDTAVSAASTATTKATEATTAAATATSAATTATTAKDDAVSAKTAAQTAQTAAETAQGKAETAQEAAEDAAESVSASAAQIATNTSDISDLKENLNDAVDIITEKMTLKSSINLVHSDSEWTSGYYIDNRSGVKTANSSLSYSAKMPVNEGDVIRLYDYFNGLFAKREIRAVAAYNSEGQFVSTTDALGWKVSTYTVPSGVAEIIISAPHIATEYMVTANAEPTEYEAYFEPYYASTFEFVEDSMKSGQLSIENLKNEFACALPKRTFRQTVGLPEAWYKKCMITPPTELVYVNGGYSSTINHDDSVVFENSSAVTSKNGYLFYAYDSLFNLLYKFDDGTGYGGARKVIAENLSDCILLAVGDSTIDQDKLTGTLLSHFTEQGQTITLLGTLGSAVDPLNKNEGRAGWTSADYMGNTSKNGYTNPFYNPITEGFDFSYYMTQQGYSGVDFVVVQLGINDLYPSNVKDIAEPDYSAIWANIKTMIDSILTYNNSVKIIINLPTTPNSDPSEHFISEFLYRHFVVRYNDYALSQIQSGYSDSKVRASYCHLILNPATDIRDNVHPTDAGYEKMALEVVNQINCWQNGV